MFQIITMHEKPASEILMHTMEWSPTDVNDNLSILQILSSYGYDEYQQFRPGMRFIESLARWLHQLPQPKKNIAFEFVKDRLLYITQDQMRQIISIVYREYIVPILSKQVSYESECGIPYWHTQRLHQSPKFKDLRRKCLFLGLSDGAQVDVFRRDSPELSHEQIYRTHEINKVRADKILNELQCDLGKSDAHFRNIFLLDDFSGSGLTYLQHKQSGWRGKLHDFYNSITSESDPLSNLIDCDDLRIWLVLYVVTEQAIKHLEEYGSKLFTNIEFSVVAIHTIPDDVKYDEGNNEAFTELIKDENYGCKGLEDDAHMKVGDTTRPYLGFDECALPLILNHNTPNNSLPILHRNDAKHTEFRGLFPRVSRHSEQYAV